jgi:hypothetical protein
MQKPCAQLRNFRFPATARLYTLIICLSANGDSSYRDATSVARLVTEQFGSQVLILSDNAHRRFDVPPGVQVHVLKDKADCLDQIDKYVRTLPGQAELLFVLSAHGFSKMASASHRSTELNGRTEYVRVHGTPLFDYELFPALYDHMRQDTRSLCLVDTCHSGTMLDLEYLSKNGGEHFQRSKQILQPRPLSVCISACDDEELAGEDVSLYGGWGGKLVCQFLDYVGRQQVPIEVLAFHRYVFQTFQQQSSQRSRPILSYNI